MTSVQLFAFNNSIAKELKERITPDLFVGPMGKTVDGAFRTDGAKSAGFRREF